MKKLFRTLVTVFPVLIICFQTSFACTAVENSLQKQFRQAKSVFVGRIVKISQYYTPSEEDKKTIPKDWKEGYWKDKDIFSKVTFEITQKWKGEVLKRQEFVAVAYFTCGCTALARLKEETEYLVFATGKNFVTVCDSKDTGSKFTKEELKRLDSFRFRVWSRIYPF